METAAEARKTISCDRRTEILLANGQLGEDDDDGCPCVGHHLLTQVSSRNRLLRD
jgi:hypothetical protein